MRRPSHGGFRVTIWQHSCAPLPIVGPLLIVGEDDRLLACAFADVTVPPALNRLLKANEVVDDESAAREVLAQVSEYLAGERHDFDVELDLRLLTDFQHATLTTLARRVGYGQRVSYAQLAGLIGSPNASRAVGRALATNPLCVVLPCHRVLSQAGTLTGYAGGLARKARLLELEGASLS